MGVFVLFPDPQTFEPVHFCDLGVGTCFVSINAKFKVLASLL